MYVRFFILVCVRALLNNIPCVLYNWNIHVWMCRVVHVLHIYIVHVPGMLISFCSLCVHAEMSLPESGKDDSCVVSHSR